MSKDPQHTCCTPVNSKLWGVKKDMLFAIFSGLFLLTGFLIEKTTSLPAYGFLLPYLISYLFGGYYTALHSYESLKEKKFDIDFLMLVAAIGAAILTNYAEGGLLLFLFSLGHSLEHYAMEKATKSISSLSELTPDIAYQKINGQIKEVAVNQLNIGDVLVIRPNSKIPADGVVIKGQSAVNQAPITGESVPVDKLPDISNKKKEFDAISNQHKVFAGTINGSNVLEIRVLRLTADSTLSRLVKLVQEAETQQSPAQKFADKFAAIFVPSVLALVFLLLFAFLILDEPFKDSFYRAMAVLVAASPCALAISTPSAVLAGIARATRGGVLLKGGLPLHELAKINAIAFDKTGTLTTGTPKLTKIYPYANHTIEEVLAIAIAVEDLSDHPLAAAIVKDGKKRIDTALIPVATQMESITAMGVSAKINDKKVYIGNRRLMEKISQAALPSELENEMQKLETNGHTAMLLYGVSGYLGIIAVQDTARPEAKSSIEKLRVRAHIQKIIMLTGDNPSVADAIAQQVGIQDAKGNLLPENKVDEILKHKNNYRIAMVGDGVNDAPAMANSNVGISMGAAGSDVALETSDVALLGDSIAQLPFAFLLAKQADRVIRQNLFMSIGVIFILVPLTILGLSIGPAVIIHEGSTLLVVANALRLLGFKDKK